MVSSKRHIHRAQELLSGIGGSVRVSRGCTDNHGRTTVYCRLHPIESRTPTSQIGQSNVRTDFRYNSALQLEATVDSANVGATAREARYQYDNFGRLSRLTNAKGQNTIYTYDRLNRIDKVTYPGGLIDEQFTYDEIGNVLTVRKGDNTTISYDYDDSNRLEKISHPSLSPSITYGYNDNDRRTTMTDETGTTSWTYNKKGQILTVAAPLTGTLEYTYDDIGRLETITDPEDVATTYTYTDRNLMASVNQDGQTISYTYDPVGNLSGKTLPNGVNCNMNYDELNRLTRLEYAQGMNAPFFSEDYALDKVGNLKRNISRTSSGTDVFRYDYDKLYRVTEVEQKVGGSFSPIETFAYDAQDNITSFNGETFSHNAADQLTSALSSSIDYDGNGNAEQIQGSSNRTITTNYADLPTEIRTGTTVNGAYTYNGDRQRVVRTARGVFGAQTTFRYLWSGSEILKDYHGNGNTRASYILGVGREAIKNSNDDGWRFYITDRLGSTRYMTDASGNITDSYTYTAYGAIKTSTSTRPSNGGDFATYYNPFLFTGQQYDSGEGNYYLRNRYYVPAYGRFLVADPIRYQGGMNLYAYCSGNPINCVDPFGLETEWTDSNARRDVYRGMLQGTFNWQNAQRMGLSILEAMSLVNPSQYLGEQAIDKFSENVPGGDANPLLKFGTKSGRRKALKNSLRTGLAPGQIRDFPSGYSIPDSSVLKTRKVWRQGSEISEQVREGLADQYPNADPLKWRKVFGDLEVEDYAGNREVFDIHWYDNPAVDALHSLKYKPPR